MPDQVAYLSHFEVYVNAVCLFGESAIIREVTNFASCANVARGLHW